MSILDKLAAARAEVRQTARAKSDAATAVVDPAFAEAARLTGMKAREIVRVGEVSEGLLIVTKDGIEMLYVPTDRPDDDGKTGLMLRRPLRSGDGVAYVPRGTRAAERRDAAKKAREVQRLAKVEQEEKAAEPSSPELELLLRMDAEAAAVIDARASGGPRPDPGLVHLARERRDAIKTLMKAETSRLISEQPVPPPDPSQVAYMAEVVVWARALVAAPTPRKALQVVARHPKFARWGTEPAMVDRELASALRFLEANGLDDQGRPIVDRVEPAPTGRRKRK